MTALKKMTDTIYITHYHAPPGTLLLGDYHGRLCLCDWENRTTRKRTDHSVQKHLNATYKEGTSVLARTAIPQLEDYFSGQRQTFTVPLILAGTPFQQKVWEAIRNIPYGMTITYTGLAEQTGNPGAIRAVAAAVGANPLSIFVPCHRVLGKSGNLTGYAGGIDVKRTLLLNEGAVLPGMSHTLFMKNF